MIAHFKCPTLNIFRPSIVKYLNIYQKKETQAQNQSVLQSGLLFSFVFHLEKNPQTWGLGATSWTQISVLEICWKLLPVQ